MKGSSRPHIWLHFHLFQQTCVQFREFFYCNCLFIYFILHDWDWGLSFIIESNECILILYMYWMYPSGSGSVSRGLDCEPYGVAGSSPRPDLNMECGLLLGEVPVHLLPCRGAFEQGTGHPPSPLTPIAPRALYNSCPLLLVLDSWY